MRETKTTELGLVCILCLIGVLLLLTGCVTANYRPHTPQEKQLLVHALIGQSLDCVTTSIALNSGDFQEGNEIWWNSEDTGGVYAAKVSMLGVGYLIGNLQPNWRKWIYGIMAGGGYGAAGWNTYQMLTY